MGKGAVVDARGRVRGVAVLSITLVALCGLSACGGGEQAAGMANLQAQLEQQRLRLNELEVKQQTSDKAIEGLRTLVISQYLESLDVAYLTPGDSGYSVVKFDLGRVTVNLIDVVSYAGGSKVTLQFGNVTSAGIDGLKGTVEWDVAEDASNPAKPTAGSAPRKKEFNMTETIEPGAWRSTQLVLEGVPPDKLGFVRLTDISHRGIRLRGKR